jgi:hypothetical protein
MAWLREYSTPKHAKTTPEGSIPLYSTRILRWHGVILIFQGVWSLLRIAERGSGFYAMD